jgi:hypothetical protein
MTNTEQTQNQGMIEVMRTALRTLFMAVMGFYCLHEENKMSPALTQALKGAYRATTDANAPIWTILDLTADRIAQSDAAVDSSVIKALGKARKALQTDIGDYETKRQPNVQLRSSLPNTVQLVALPMLCPGYPLGYSIKSLDGVLHFHGSAQRSQSWLQANGYTQGFANLWSRQGR